VKERKKREEERERGKRVGNGQINKPVGENGKNLEQRTSRWQKHRVGFDESGTTIKRPVRREKSRWGETNRCDRQRVG